MGNKNSSEATTNNGPDQVIGPYENWMLGPGKTYDLPEAYLRDSTEISAIVTVGDGVAYTGPINGGLRFPIFAQKAAGDSFQEQKTPDFVWSQIWRPLSQMGSDVDGENQSLHFVPCIIRTENKQDGLSSFLFDSLKDGLLTIGSKNAEAPTDLNEYRVGAPLEAGVFNEHQSNELIPKLEPVGLAKGEKSIVIQAIIDDGIPFAGRFFRSKKSGKTRLDYYWNQSIASSVSESSVLFGAEISSKKIDELIKQYNGDEDAIYQSANAFGGSDSPVSSLNGRYSHGSHVADLMTRSMPEDKEDQVRVIAVDLPDTSVWDTSGYGKEMFVLAAMHYIFDRADRIAEAYGKKHCPLIINLSYGYSGGPHNGTGLIEAALEEMIKVRRKSVTDTVLVMPSGNLFQDRLHGVLGYNDLEQCNSLDWRIQPNDRTSNYLEIWLPEGMTPAGLDFQLSAPGDEKPEFVNPSKAEVTVDGNKTSLIDQEFFLHVKHENQLVGQFSIDHYRKSRWRIMIILAPTEVKEISSEWGVARAGVWKLSLSFSNVETEEEWRKFSKDNAQYQIGENEQGKEYKISSLIECWIQRDDDFGLGKTGARQSLFDDKNNILRYSDGSLSQTDSLGWHEGPYSYVRRFGTMNGMSTGQSVVVVGGYNSVSGEAVSYTSGAALRKNDKGEWAMQTGDVVDCSAPIEFGWLRSGTRGSGTRSGSNVRIGGTSAAAPQVARTLTLAALEGKRLTLENGKLRPTLLKEFEADESSFVTKSRYFHQKHFARLGTTRIR